MPDFAPEVILTPLEEDRLACPAEVASASAVSLWSGYAVVGPSRCQGGRRRFFQQSDFTLLIKLTQGCRSVRCGALCRLQCLRHPAAHLETFDWCFRRSSDRLAAGSRRPWAKVVYDSLKPGGSFFLIEFHPASGCRWGRICDPLFYFNAGPITELGSGTYAEREAKITYREHGWNHPLSDLMSALISGGPARRPLCRV